MTRPVATLDNSRHDAAVTAAIHAMTLAWEAPPDLEALASSAGLSPGHFQRAFKRRVGISPKRFAQHLKLTRAEDLLRRRTGVLEATYAAGLSGPGRLHDLMVECVAMTPAEYRNAGTDLRIQYGIAPTPVGQALVASTQRGLCWLSFGDMNQGLAELRRDWSRAAFEQNNSISSEIARELCRADAGAQGRPITVLLRGTNFQMQVWRALLRIPHGSLRTYGDLAHQVDAPAASRAVGAACGANRVSWLIPCHRVIGQSGALTGYRWGSDAKRALLAREGAFAT